MCLLFVAWRRHPRYSLLVAANRDEFHARPAAPLARWRDDLRIAAGRDLEAGGTWFGARDGGRFAALTNYRDGEARPSGAASRGELVAGFLGGAGDAWQAARSVSAAGRRYAGFNLFVADGSGAGGGFAWCSNRGDGPRLLEAGVYGLSNHLLDTPWPKVTLGKQRFAELLAQDEPGEEALFAMLADRSLPADHELPDTGIGIQRERALGSAFIVGEAYGTRASTLLFVDSDGGGRIVERSFDARGEPVGESRVTLAPAGNLDDGPHGRRT